MADTELASMTEETAPVGTDLLYMTDSGGTQDRKLPIATLQQERIQTTSQSSAYNLDWDLYTYTELTLTGNVTISFSNVTAGRSVTLLLIQDGTGSRTVTWPGAVNWPNGEPTIQSGASEITYITLFVRNDGTTVEGFTANEESVESRVVLHEETLAATGRFDVSSIPATYTHLEIRAVLRSDVSATQDGCLIHLNADTTASNYRRAYLIQNSATPQDGQDDSTSFGNCPAATSQANDFGTFYISILNYAGSHNKQVHSNYMTRRDATDTTSGDIWINWESTAAINQITLQPDGYATDEFVAGSYLQIIGIKSS